MKKRNGVCLILALVLLVQCLGVSVLATAADPQAGVTVPPTETPTEPPLPTVMVGEQGVPDIPFGDAGVDYGCRTIGGKSPLGGSEKLLKTARAAFVYETKSDTVLYAYNPDEQLLPGGLVQIVTAMLAIENCDLDENVTVSTYYINQLPLGVRHVELRNGEVLTVRDLLYCLMLSSANDAAVVLAQHIAGSPEQFVTMMNQRIQGLGCMDTWLTNVSGLDDPNQYTTARDMARILDVAMEYEEFRAIASAGTYTVAATNKHDIRELQAMNYLLKDAAVSKFYNEKVTGGKASYTSAEAGASIAFTAESEELSLVCVILGATRKYITGTYSPSSYGNFEEAETLIDHCFQQFHVRRLLYQGQTMTQLEVAGGANGVVAVNDSDIDIVLPTGVGLQDLALRYGVIGGTLRAPVKAGQEIASLQLWYGDACVGETTLYAMSDVAKAEEPGFTIQDGATRSDADMGQLILFLGAALTVILIPVSIYLIVNAARKAAARRRARKMRRQRRDERMQRRRTGR